MEAWLIAAEDASTDGTPGIVRAFASHNNNVVLTSSRTLAGKGAAVKRGPALATGDVLGFIDADGSIHPSDFTRVAAAINGESIFPLGQETSQLYHCPPGAAVEASLRVNLSSPRTRAAPHRHNGLLVRMQGVAPGGMDRNQPRLRVICIRR